MYGYYLSVDFKCVPFKKNSRMRIKNCIDFRFASECLVCNNITYNKDGMCRYTKKRINNCTMYRSPTKCGICDLMVPSLDGSSCELLANADENCMLFNHPYYCKRCKPGFVRNRNLYLKNLPSLYRDLFFHLKFWKNDYYDVVFNLAVCEFSYSIENCKELDYDRKCKVCEGEFTLSSNREICFLRPLPPSRNQKIPKCFKFTN